MSGEDTNWRDDSGDDETYPPHEKTLRTLKRLRKAKAKGTLVIEQ